MSFVSPLFLSFILLCLFFACVTQTQQNSQLQPSNKPMASEKPLPTPSLSLPATSTPLASSSTINTPIPVLAATDPELKIVSESINNLGFLIFNYLQKSQPNKNILFSPLNIYIDLIKTLKSLPADQSLKIRAKIGTESLTVVDIDRILNILSGKIANSYPLNGSDANHIAFKSNFDAETYKSKTNVFNGSNEKLNGGFIDICKKSTRLYKDSGFLYDKSYFPLKESPYTIEFIGAKLENSLKFITYAMTLSQWKESNKKILNNQYQVCTTIPRFRVQIQTKINLDDLFELTNTNKTIEQNGFFDNTHSDTKLLEPQNFSSEYNLSMFEHMNLKQPFGMIVTGKNIAPIISEEPEDTIILMGLIQNLNRAELTCDINEGCTSQ